MITKKQLLETYSNFLDNDYLDAYIDLLNANTEIMSDMYVEKHHIVPRAYFKHYGLKIDNSNENLCTLTLHDHILAHWLLLNCTDGFLKQINAKAFIRMTNWTSKRSGSKLVINSEDLDTLQQRMNIIFNDPDSIFWKKDEVDWLLANYTNLGATECAKHLKNRSVDTIRVMARKLKLTDTNKFSTRWTSDEINCLKLNFSNISDKELSHLFPNRSLDAIKYKAKILGLYKNNYSHWTSEEIQILKDNITEPTKYLQQKFFNNRSRYSIDSKRLELRDA